MFKKILIANRGEIFVRIAKTLQQMGSKVVAIYPKSDAQAFHLQFADEMHLLEGSTLKETYLSIQQILKIAKENRVDAIHPGYGFLSENAAFAMECQKENLTFIGPSAEAIQKLGDKILAKQIMTKAGVPVVPGWLSETHCEVRDAQKVADEIGYPVLIKATAGGGGKGVRLVEKRDDLPSLFESAQREAQSAFGDGRVFIEKFFRHPRHVEFQIFGDHHDNVIHLGERECSIQRRYQKIVEESPSFISNKLREKMGEVAIRAAQAVQYKNAGTVEFLVDEENRFYFLEVNTRLQVEHPVTEMVTGEDLVKTQVLVASGEKLSSNVNFQGHAIECRIYAEDPYHNFFPSIGMLAHYVPPNGPGIRIDAGVTQGSTITIDYDPMIAKLIVHAKTRQEAIAKMNWALRHFVVLGVTTNIEFLQSLMEHKHYIEGKIHTQFLQETPSLFERQETIPEYAIKVSELIAKAPHKKHSSFAHTPWEDLKKWRAFQP